jgi:sulfate transport system ATP-binding protein
VNLLYGRLDRGRALIGGIELAAPEHAEAEEQPAVACVRPYDIEIERVFIRPRRFDLFPSQLH